MRIGVIGLGVVGSAIKTGFEELGHDVLCHDIKLDTNNIAYKLRKEMEKNFLK